MDDPGKCSDKPPTTFQLNSLDVQTMNAKRKDHKGDPNGVPTGDSHAKPAGQEVKPAGHEGERAAREREVQKFELRHLLSPHLGFDKDTRGHSHKEQSDKNAIEKPISSHEFEQARKILHLDPKTSDDATRRAVAKSLGLAETAKNTDIRTKVGLDEQNEKFLKQFEPRRLEPKHFNLDELPPPRPVGAYISTQPKIDLPPFW